MIARCTRGSKDNIVSKMRSQGVAQLPLDYIASPEFVWPIDAQTEKRILGYDLENVSVQANEERTTNSRNCANHAYKQNHESMEDIPSWLFQLGKTALLTQEQEIHLFRKYNYLKFKAAHFRNELDVAKPKAKAELLAMIERLFEEAITVRNQIICANLRLVISVAKKHTGVVPLYDLISEGNVSLIKAVEKFDYSRGNKFSTYASWAIFRNFGRTIVDEMKYRQRFFSTDIDQFELLADSQGLACRDERVGENILVQTDLLMEELDDRERAIIQRRYGLGIHDSPQTLRQVGEEMGVTKERVRQIETRAIAKLRNVVKEKWLDIPEYY